MKGGTVGHNFERDKNHIKIFCSQIWVEIKFCAKKFQNFLPGTLAFYRIVNISNDQQMSLISHCRSFNSSFQKCRFFHSFTVELYKKKKKNKCRVLYGAFVSIFKKKKKKLFFFCLSRLFCEDKRVSRKHWVKW
jgi:hypothetical protein